MAQTVGQRQTNSIKTIRGVKIIFLASPRWPNTSSGHLHISFDWAYVARQCYVFIKPNIKPKLTPIPLFHEEEDDGVSHESRRFILPLQKLPPTANSVKSAKRLGRGDKKGFSTEGSEKYVLQASTSHESRLNRDEKTDASITDTFGRLAVASWKYHGGKGKEWRKAPWKMANSVHRGVPETFVKRFSSKRFSSSKNHRWFSGRQSETKKFDHSALKSSTAEAVADVADVYSQWENVEDEAPWPQEQANESARENGHSRMPGRLDDNSQSQKGASISLPNDSYSGAIIGGRFRLDGLIEEDDTSGEKTYVVSDLMAPERRLVARLYNLLGLPREFRDSRKRHMKRLIRRENGYHVRQDGKIYIVHTCDELPSPSTSTRFSAHDRIRRGTKPPGSFKTLQDNTEFPPLSINASRAKPNALWEPSKVRDFLNKQKQQASATRPGAADRLVPGQISAPKRKRHRWRKAKRHDPPEPCTASEPMGIAVLPSTDEKSREIAIPQSDMVDPSFVGLIEMDKHLEIHADTIIAMATEVWGCDLSAVRKAVGINSMLLTKVIDDMAWLELKYADQTARARTVLNLMRHHLSVQTRRKEVKKLIEKAGRMHEQMREKWRLEHRLRVRLMKGKEGKAKERTKVIHAKVCKALDDISLALEEDFHRKEEILAGGTAFRT